MKLLLSTLGLAAALSFSLSAFAAPPVQAKGDVLTCANGHTLYTFDKDQAGSGKSACNGPCAANWPILAASADAKASGDWTVVTRDDGSKMWALKGKPLYTFAKDTKPGDTTGDGFLNGAWHIAKP